jgi:hypothetical protein
MCMYLLHLPIHSAAILKTLVSYFYCERQEMRAIENKCTLRNHNSLKLFVKLYKFSPAKPLCKILILECIYNYISIWYFYLQQN